MSSSISRTLIQLRKENSLSQKEVATDLGISQALLSHYEKGIRECGLDFLVKVANYYNVSCDFLLGRSPEKNGTLIDGLSIKEINEDTVRSDNSIKSHSTFLIQKKLIINSLYIIFDILSKIGNSVLSTKITTIISLSIYRVIRIISVTHKGSEQQIFSYKQPIATAKASAITMLCEAEAFEEALIMSNNKVIETGFILNEDTLQREYSEYKTSVLNIIKNCEDTMDIKNKK